MKRAIIGLVGLTIIGAAGFVVSKKSGIGISKTPNEQHPCSTVAKYICTPLNYKPSVWSHDLKSCEKYINISKNPTESDESRCRGAVERFDREAREKGFPSYKEMIQKVVKNPKYLSALNDENIPPNPNNYVHPCDKMARLFCSVYGMTNKACVEQKNRYQSVITGRTNGLFDEVEAKTSACESDFRYLDDQAAYSGGYLKWVRAQVKDKEVLKTLEDLD